MVTKTRVKVNMTIEKRIKIATKRFTGWPDSRWDMLSQLQDHTKGVWSVGSYQNSSKRRGGCTETGKEWQSIREMGPGLNDSRRMAIPERPCLVALEQASMAGPEIVVKLRECLWGCI